MREKLANMQPEKMQQLTCKHTDKYRITHTHQQTIKLLTLMRTYTQTDNHVTYNQVYSHSFSQTNKHTIT